MFLELIFFCLADHVPDWQPRILLVMVKARSVNVKKTTTLRILQGEYRCLVLSGLCCRYLHHGPLSPRSNP